MLKMEALQQQATPDHLDSLKDKLILLYQKMIQAQDRHKSELNLMHPTQVQSAKNLLHYLALRSVDIRNLQDDLHMRGLSSLASSESHIMWQLQAVMNWIGINVPKYENELNDYFTGQTTMQERSAALFGSQGNEDIQQIMVTFDTVFAYDFNLVMNLLNAGMGVARINCAHDNQAIWEGMIANIRKASKMTGISCKIYMDLAGPKIRTTILGKGKENHKVSLKECSSFLLAEDNAAFDKKEIVIGCSEPGILRQLKEGERVLFDDGVIEAIVESNTEAGVRLQIVHISGKPRLKAGKGINFPDSQLSIASLTENDLSVLPFIVEQADLIGYSFVRKAEDLVNLQQRIKELAETPPPIIIKIETLDAVTNLPSLLLQGMREKYFGVMIARGDLAVEIGFERTSEIQEEILWLCEAAHTPAIWATQVLESLNKSGLTTRSEVTDAARSAMAECVMLNKGPYLFEVIETLKDILHRSGGHLHKKRYSFRPLSIASNYFTHLNESMRMDSSDRII